MIVWSGWGILTVLIAAVVGGGASVLFTALFKAVGLAQPSGDLGTYALVPGLLVAAAVNWFVGRRLNSRPGREMIDKTTGQTLVLRQRHSLFFIRMEWWSVVMVIGAAIGLFAVLFGDGDRTPRPRTTTAAHGLAGWHDLC